MALAGAGVVTAVQRFPGNCLIVAAVMGLRGYEVRTMRNRSGRLHFYWRDEEGRAFEFYTKGASRRSYLRNALTLGEIRRAPALDRTVAAWERRGA